MESKEFRGTKLRRTCYLRYYPNDRRTAAINVMKNDTCSVKHLDVFLDSFKMRNGRVVVVVDEERIKGGPSAHEHIISAYSI